MRVRFDSPELSDGVREAVVVADDVEETAKGCDGEKVDQAEGHLRDEGTEYGGTYVVHGDRFQAPGKIHYEH